MSSESGEGRNEDRDQEGPGSQASKVTGKREGGCRGPTGS